MKAMNRGRGHVHDARNYEYYEVHGMRHVRPYHHTFAANVKQRWAAQSSLSSSWYSCARWFSLATLQPLLFNSWMGKKLLDILVREFGRNTPLYYVGRLPLPPLLSNSLTQLLAIVALISLGSYVGG
jgi:hypothetical protein